MKYATAGAFRTALEDRLNHSAKDRGQKWLMRQRKLIVFDRLLARLLIAAPGLWTLKGAVALGMRFGDQAQMTMDLDLARADSERLATEDLEVAQVTDPGDFFTFQSERTTQLDWLTEATAVRYRVRADLAGRRFEEFNLDIGFSEAGDLPQEILRGPEIFCFAEIPPIEVPTLPLVLHVSEKLHAYERVDAEQRRSTRVKDLVDLALICSMSSFRVGDLMGAIQQTFAARADRQISLTLAQPPDDRSLPFRTIARETGLHLDLKQGHQMVAVFLEPVLSGLLPFESRWDPTRHAWGPADMSDHA